MATSNKEVTQRVVQGKSNTEIAQILGVRTEMIEKYLEWTYRKLGIENRDAASARVNELACFPSLNGFPSTCHTNSIINMGITA